MKQTNVKRKVLFSLTLCVVLSLSLGACSLTGEGYSPLTGTWKLNGSYNFSTGYVMDIKDWHLEGDGTTATLEFNKDKSYKLIYNQYGKKEETYTGTYELQEGSDYLMLKHDKSNPGLLTIMYMEDLHTFEDSHDNWILITTQEKKEDEEEQRYFYLLRQYDR